MIKNTIYKNKLEILYMYKAKCDSWSDYPEDEKSAVIT